MFNAFFRENHAVYEIMSNYPVRVRRGHKRRRNTAHKPCLLDKQDYMQSRACTRPRAYSRARTRTRPLTGTNTHAPTLAHTYMYKYVILIAFPWQLIRESASCCVIRTFTVCFLNVTRPSTASLK